MVAPVASGTLAGSTSGSWASIRKQAASSRLLALPSTPSGPTTRTTLSTVAESDIIVGHDFRKPREKQKLEIGVTGGARFVVGEARGRESAVVCQQPSVLRCPQFGGSP